MKPYVAIFCPLKVNNLFSIEKMLNKLDLKYKIIKSSEFKDFTHVIMPGVGSFDKMMKALKKNKLKKNSVKFLGICLGMQVLSKIGYEGKKSKGLGLIDGQVKKIEGVSKNPIIGYNTIKQTKKLDLFNNINKKSKFYFMHSYGLFDVPKKYIYGVSLVDGKKIISVIKIKNFYGVQFHPEKSGVAGIKFFKNFIYR